MERTFSKFQKFRTIAAIFVVMALQSQIPSDLSAQTQAAKPHFECHAGYTKRECQAAVAVLRNALARYPVDTLGEWTWVLLRTADWKYVLAAKGFNVNDPAFSNLTKRVTFLDGSLADGACIRGVELRLIWRMPIEELLDFTVRHELAHALCNERDEFEANRVAIRLKNGMPLSCRAFQVAQGEADNTKIDRVGGVDERGRSSN